MKRIFLVGAPRSGTTLLQSLVAAHPRVASFTESHLFSRYFSRRLRGRAVLLRPGLRERAGEFLRENGLDPARFATLLDALPSRGSWLPWRSSAAARGVIALLDAAAAERGADTWLEKTPMHLRQLEVIEPSVPGGEVRFIHIVRRGPDMVASLYAASRAWGEGYSLEQCARRWNRDLEHTLARLRAGHPDVVVLYEELTASPRRVVDEVLRRLGLEPDDAIMERYRAVAGSVTAEGERWKEGSGRRIEPSSTFEDVFAPAQRDRALAAIRGDLYDEVRGYVGGAR